MMRGVAEYCADLLASVQPAQTNIRPSYCYYWLPAAFLAVLFLIVSFRHWRAVVKKMDDPWPTLSKALIVSTWLLTATAITGAIVHLSLPRMTVSERSLGLTRRWLVTPSERAEFDYLA